MVIWFVKKCTFVLCFPNVHTLCYLNLKVIQISDNNIETCKTSRLLIPFPNMKFRNSSAQTIINLRVNYEQYINLSKRSFVTDQFHAPQNVFTTKMDFDPYHRRGSRIQMLLLKLYISSYLLLACCLSTYF